MGCEQVVTIGNARVPIFTFFDALSKTHCDISLIQPLGEMNSKLIKTYSQIDHRFRPLCFAVRQIVKRHNILSGPKGYLSSYCLLLMVITRLQTKTIPLLPVLQDQRNMVEGTVEGWDRSYDWSWSNYRRFGDENMETVVDLGFTEGILLVFWIQV